MRLILQTGIENNPTEGKDTKYDSPVLLEFHLAHTYKSANNLI